MQRYQLQIDRGEAGEEQNLDVPNLATALIVADINIARGTAQILKGEEVVARIEKHGAGQAPYWVVD